MPSSPGLPNSLIAPTGPATPLPTGNGSGQAPIPAYRNTPGSQGGSGISIYGSGISGSQLVPTPVPPVAPAGPLFPGIPQRAPGPSLPATPIPATTIAANRDRMNLGPTFSHLQFAPGEGITVGPLSGSPTAVAPGRVENFNLPMTGGVGGNPLPPPSAPQGSGGPAPLGRPVVPFIPGPGLIFVAGHGPNFLIPSVRGPQGLGILDQTFTVAGQRYGAEILDQRALLIGRSVLQQTLDPTQIGLLNTINPLDHLRKAIRGMIGIFEWLDP